MRAAPSCLRRDSTSHTLPWEGVVSETGSRSDVTPASFRLSPWAVPRESFP